MLEAIVIAKPLIQALLIIHCAAIVVLIVAIFFKPNVRE